MGYVGKGDKHIIIENDSEEETARILEDIHKQLMGNKDYIINNIRVSAEGCGVHLYILNECKNVPKIQI